MAVSANFSTKKEPNKKHFSSSVSRNSKIIKKRRDNQLKYNLNTEIMNSVNASSFPMNSKHMRYDSLTKLEGNSLKTFALERGIQV